MNSGFKSYDRNQLVLFPPILGDWIPKDDFSWFIVDAISKLGLDDFCKAYTPGVGRKAYPPEILFGVLIYAYSKGTQSSRKIEELCLTDVKFRFVSANLLPDHSTISRFRKNHEIAISDLFKQVLQLAAQFWYEARWNDIFGWYKTKSKRLYFI